MPWTPADASRHTHKAKSEAQKKQWSAIANSVLQRTGDEGKAIQIASGKIKAILGSKSKS